MLVLGLGHRARQGKDTLAAFIKQEYTKYDIRLYSFGKALKDEVNAFYEIYSNESGWDGVWNQLTLEHDMPIWAKPFNENLDMTDPLCPYGKQRALLQWWGTEYRRAESPNYWVKSVDKAIKFDNPQVAIVTDVRFPNEFYWVKSFDRDGVTVKVERTNYYLANEHISEKALDGYDFDVKISADNLEELYEAGRELMNVLIKREQMPEEFFDFSV